MTAQRLRLLKASPTPTPLRPVSALPEEDVRLLRKQRLRIKTRYIELVAEAARLRDGHPARVGSVEVPAFRPVLVPDIVTPPPPLWRPVSDARLPTLLRFVNLVREFKRTTRNRRRAT